MSHDGIGYSPVAAEPGDRSSTRFAENTTDSLLSEVGTDESTVKAGEEGLSLDHERRIRATEGVAASRREHSGRDSGARIRNSLSFVIRITEIFDRLKIYWKLRHGPTINPGLLIQPIVGVYSDKCTFKFGRRRPFMIGGGLLVVSSVFLIAYSKETAAFILKSAESIFGHVPASFPSMKTLTIMIAVVAFYFLDFSINAVQASCRSLIVDAVPSWQQEAANAWAGRMIGLGNVIGYLMGWLKLPVYLPFLGDTQLKVLCVLAIMWFTTTLGLTCWTVKEVPFVPDSRRPNRAWYAPLMDILHALRSLPAPIQGVCNVQFWSWLGWFPFLFYSTTWVAEKAEHGHMPGPGDGDDMPGARAGSLALLLFAIVSVVTGFVLPLITIRGGVDLGGGQPAMHERLLSWLALPRVWALSMWLFAVLMGWTGFVSTVVAATIIIAATGISWGTTQWVPFTLMGEYISHYSENGEQAADPSDSSGYGAVPADDEEAHISTSTIDHAVSPTPHPPLDAGMVLGIHNIYIVLPQFISTFLSSVVFALIAKIAEWNGDDANNLEEVDKYDSVGWVLRLGALASIWAGVVALRVKEVQPGSGARKVVMAGGH
ncbi:hypothetical protein HK104_001196 [Borealophlyctis nickersoniae]|nr:hypothetical protein HK104_001196 [Borealophlyctis nickersoniae]